MSKEEQNKNLKINLLKDQINRYNEDLKNKDEQIKILLEEKKIFTDRVNLTLGYYPCEKANMVSVSNLLSIINCVKKLRGQPSNSASPTDIYILDMNSNFLYEGEHVKTIYMKIFISGMDSNTTTIRPSNSNLDNQMSYEYMVYLSKIKDIVKLNICPYFVKVLGGNLKVRLFDLATLLYNRLPGNQTNIEIFNRFFRNMNYVYTYTKDRPSIENPVSPTDLFPDEKLQNSLINADYGFFMTEGTQNTITLEQYINYNLDQPIDYFNIILFQLIVACRAMNLAKLAHNDLHHANILVEEVKGLDKCCFLTNDGKNNKIYAITTPFRIRIYDFDRGFINGDHPYDNPIAGSLNRYSMSNNLVQKRDLAKCLSYFFINSKFYRLPGSVLQKDYHPPVYTSQRKFLENIANVLIKDSKDPFNDLKAFYDESGNFLRKSPTMGRNEDSDFAIFNRSWDEMLDKAYDLLPSYVKYDLTTRKGELCDDIRDFNVYYMFPQTFDEEGTIKLRELEKIKYSIIKDVCTK